MKRILLALGTITAVVAPIATVVACGSSTKDTTTDKAPGTTDTTTDKAPGTTDTTTGKTPAVTKSEVVQKVVEDKIIPLSPVVRPKELPAIKGVGDAFDQSYISVTPGTKTGTSIIRWAIPDSIKDDDISSIDVMIYHDRGTTEVHNSGDQFEVKVGESISFDVEVAPDGDYENMIPYTFAVDLTEDMIAK